MESGARQFMSTPGLTIGRWRRFGTGRRKYVRRETRELIFSVPFDGHCDRSVIDAEPTWRMINAMLSRQDTRSEIAKRIGGYVGKNGFASLQIGNTKVIARTQMRVEKLYNDAIGL
jgi:hypothetical protein